MKQTTACCLLVLAIVLTASCNNSADTQEKRPEQVPMVIAANELAAQSRLRSIVTAEQSYQAETAQYGSLDELIKRNYISDPSEGKLTGYRFEVKVTSNGFELTAVPEKYGITGKRSFFVDESNVTRAGDHKGAPATASDPQA
jgi:uncharacterized lipoprotein YajG